MIRKLFFIGIALLLHDRTFAQAAKDQKETDKPFHAAINLQACFRGDSVVLRWAPETPGAWREVNKAGFIISRTVLNDDGSFDPATFLNLTADPIKPWPLERWAIIAGQNSTDNFAKIAAQTLYGKALVPTNGFIAKADEFATRFSFAMLAADMSPNAARAMGLRFADKNIQKGTSYVYRVVSNVDVKKYQVDAGVIIVHTKEPQPMPQVVVDHSKARDNVIELYWKRDLHDPFFSAYYIERSDDHGKSYKRLNASPFVHAVSEKTPVSAEYMVYTDSVKTNYKDFSYRVVGITPYGELAPASTPVTATGRDRTPPATPMHVKTKHMGGSRIKISWEYPKQSKDIKGFLIGRGNNPAKEFIPLTTDPLPPKTREFIDDKADVMASNYYIVAVVDTAGNASVSLAQYAMVIDSLPPAPPTKLTGVIDSTGIVKITWKRGPEKDIKGYLVFFANHADHEFSQLTHGPLADTVYRDTIAIKTLTKKIYYRVVAIDYNSNYSKFSEILELKRPDVVPPSGAVMDHYKITARGIEFHWVASTSEDLAKTVLYRLDDKSKNWEPIATFPATDKKQSYTDTTSLQAGKIYSYSLMCFDDAGLHSVRSIPVKLKFPDLKNYQPVNVIAAKPVTNEKNILITWNYPVKGEYRFILYRAVNGSAFDSYKSLNSSVSVFKDEEVKTGNSYEYSIGVIFKNGKKSPYGKIVKTVF